MTVGPEEAVPVVLLSTGAIIALACVIIGRPLRDLCTVALWCNMVAFGLALIPLVAILNAMRTSSEAGLALGWALALPAPFLAGFLVFAAIRRWRMRQAKPPT